MCGQDVDRRDFALVGGISGALRTADREADDLSGSLGHEAKLRLRLGELAETISAPVRVRPHPIEERVRKEAAIGRLPGRDTNLLDRLSVVDRREPDAHVR